MLIKTHIYFPFDFYVVYLDSNVMLYVYPWSSKQNTLILTLTLTQFISDNNNENYVTILHKQERKRRNNNDNNNINNNNNNKKY